MSAQTMISWCDSTFNPWIGCTKVSPACDHCYAERLMDHRMHRVRWGSSQARMRTSVENWRQPLRWNAKRFMQCDECGWRGEAAAELIGCGVCGSLDLNDTRRRVFCASLADVFDNEVPRAWRFDLFELISRTPHLDWLLLTKRIGNAHDMLRFDAGTADMPRNVWLGATICNQVEADRDIPKLLATPAAVLFVSIEPMLGDIRLGSWLQRSPSAAFEAGCVTAAMSDWTRIGSTAIDWVIAGGESGPHARPTNPNWVRSLRDQCADAGVPFHFKQWGEWLPGSQARDVGNQMALVVACDRGWKWDDGTHSWRIGTKAAGRLLDGVEHNGFPA